MIFLIARVIAFFGVDIQKAQKAAIWVLIGIIGLAVLVVGLWVRSCFNKPAKLDEAEIQKAQEAVKTRNDTELRRILVESDVKEKQIDANVANAKAETVKAIEEAKKKYNEMTLDELAAELEKRSY